MVRRIIWSKNALRDKVQILDYWHKRIGTKTYSQKLDKKLKESIKLLAIFILQFIFLICNHLMNRTRMTRI